jgi:metallophosphoesterase superfamily enzyme
MCQITKNIFWHDICCEKPYGIVRKLFACNLKKPWYNVDIKKRERKEDKKMKKSYAIQTMTKREVEVLVLSDIHLGTQGCHAKELLQYLKTVQPKMVVLNGDIIDIWQFKKRYWPPLHTAILLHFIAWASEQIPVYYITGNHDEYLRKFADTELGSLKIKNKLSLKLNNKQVWIFHGDVFDVVMQHSKWLAKLG